MLQSCLARGMAEYYPPAQQQPPPPTDSPLLPAVERVEQFDWSYVERLMPQRVIPIPTPKSEYPSGWTPQIISEEQKAKYWLKRSRNHMLPVYIKLMDAGYKRCTVVNNVVGDIFMMHNELKHHLEKVNGKYLASQVNEARMVITFRGDFVDQIKQWLRDRDL